MKIMDRLGLSPMLKMETIKEAGEAYEYYWHRRNERRSNLALERWNDLCLPIIEEARAAGDIEGFFRALSSIWLPSKGKAYDLACQAIRDVLPGIITPKQAHKYLLILGCYFSPSRDLRLKWEELSLEAISKAATFEEMKTLIEDVLLKDNRGREEEIYRKAILKWAELSNTIEEIDEVIYNSSLGYSCSWGSTRESLISRSESILFFEIPKIKDIKKIKHCYHCLVSDNGTAKLMVFERWLEICTTPEQADEAFRAASEDKCRLMAYNKAKQLASSFAQTT